MMKVKNIALVAGSSVALFAGSLVVAPAAWADCKHWEEDCWGAIAYSPKRGHGDRISTRVNSLMLQTTRKYSAPSQVPQTTAWW